MSFDFPQRFDKDAAQTGEWFTPITEMGASYGRFRVRFMDANCPKLIRDRARLLKQHDHAMRTKQMSEEDFYIILWLEYAPVDWDGITFKGEPVPYTHEKFKEYFAIPESKHALSQLVNFTMSVENFQGSTPEDVKKK